MPNYGATAARRTLSLHARYIFTYRFTVTIGTPNVCTISLLHRTACNHLAGEHAETPYVLLFVLEHRQMTVDITTIPPFVLQSGC